MNDKAQPIDVMEHNWSNSGQKNYEPACNSIEQIACEPGGEHE